MERIDNINSGVELCFLDKRDGGLRLCAKLYSSAPVSYVEYVINGEGKTADIISCTQISDTFCHIFTIFLDATLLADNVALTFKESVRTSHFFPIDLKCNGYHQIDNILVYNEGEVIMLSPATKALLKERRKKYKVLFFNKASLVAYAMRVVSWLLKPFFKKDVWLISDRLHKAGDNGEVFFDYVTKNTPSNVKPIFVLDKKSSDYKRMKAKGKVISPRSILYKLYYLMAKMNISSQLDGSRLLKVRPYLKDIMNKQKIIFLQHGVIKDDLSTYYNRFDFGMDMFVTTTKGEYDSIVGIKNYWCDKEITSLVGLCRYDRLENEKEKIIFICPTWRLSLLEDTENETPIKDFENSQYFRFYNHLLHNTELISKAKECGYRICFYPHQMMEKTNAFFKNLDPVVILGGGYSYNDVFRKGDLLLTDYSSIQFDFAYLKKPVIYAQFDKDEFTSSHTYVPGYFDYEKHGFGPVSTSLDDTVALLCNYMDNGCAIEEKYEQRINNTFMFTDKGNCERTLKRILEIRNA